MRSLSYSRHVEAPQNLCVMPAIFSERGKCPTLWPQGLGPYWQGTSDGTPPIHISRLLPAGKGHKLQLENNSGRQETGTRQRAMLFVGDKRLFDVYLVLLVALVTWYARCLESLTGLLGRHHAVGGQFKVLLPRLVACSAPC